MPQSAKFWDKIADRYSRKPISDEATYQKKLEVTRQYLRPDMAIMEFGCGTGGTAIAHAPYVQHVLATDISSRMIEIAKGKAEAGDVKNVTFEVATIESLEAADRSFDAVLGMSILHLLEDKGAAIAKVHKLLDSGGVFVSSTVCLGDNMRWFRFVGPIGRALGLMPLVRIFSHNELEQSLIGAGFELDHVWQPDNGHAVFIVARKKDCAVDDGMARPTSETGMSPA